LAYPANVTSDFFLGGGIFL